MKRKKKSRAKKMSERTVNKRKALMRQRALSGCKAYTVEEAIALNIKDGWIIQDHISGLFPLFLQLASEGYSVRKIEETLHISNRLLVGFLYRNQTLNSYLKAAKSLKTDEVMLQ
jgi:hypothetical protein